MRLYFIFTGILAVAMIGCFPQPPWGEVRGTLSDASGDYIANYGVNVSPGTPVDDDPWTTQASIRARSIRGIIQNEQINRYFRKPKFYPVVDPGEEFVLNNVELVGVYTVIVELPNGDIVFNTVEADANPPGIILSLSVDSGGDLILDSAKQLTR